MYLLKLTSNLLIAALLLSACESSPENKTPPAPVAEYANVFPGNEAWAMEDGTFAEYEISAFKGSLQKDGRIVIVSVDPPSDGSRVTNLQSFQPLASLQRATARVHTRRGEKATAVDPALVGVLLERQSSVAIGESGNRDALLIEPLEPLITPSPRAGEELFTTSKATTPGGISFYLYTLYRTLAVEPGLVTTSLVENPGTPGLEVAYNHEFDGEIKRLWYGKVEADGSIDGFIAVRVLRGRNEN